MSENTPQRIVIKIGSSLLVDKATGKVRREWLRSLCEDVADFKQAGHQVVIVSSGAIALGRRLLGLPINERLRLPESQAAAATGQVRLAGVYAEEFRALGIAASQILLTMEDTEDRRRYLNARATTGMLLHLGAVPVINENDTITTTEIRFGDNDRLSARVATMVSADRLILFSDIDGLYTADPGKDPNAEFIPVVHEISDEIENMGGGSASGLGTGGMETKIAAAKIACNAGCETIITLGEMRNPLKALGGGARHTRFLASTSPDAARKRWIAAGLDPRGTLYIDDGAVVALHHGKSLLPAGIKRIDGQFDRGDPVVVCDRDGHEIARGLTAYNAADAEAIAGKHSLEIEAILGYSGRDVIIHRDDLALTGRHG